MSSEDIGSLNEYYERRVKLKTNMFNLMKDRKGVLGGYTFKWQGRDTTCGATVYLGRRGEDSLVLLSYYPVSRMLRVNAETEQLAGEVLEVIIEDIS